MSHLVFVFGTLKQGFPNHHTLAQQTLLGAYETELAYPLYLVGERHSPWMMDQPGEGMKVSGQLFRVDDDTLAAIDQLERTHRSDGYRRQTLSVINRQRYIKRQVFCYLKPAYQLNPKMISCGPIAEYLPEHAQRYRYRSC